MGDTPVGERLATIETKLDLLIVKRDDHEVRLRALERARYIALGGGTVLGAAAGAIVNVLFGA